MHFSKNFGRELVALNLLPIRGDLFRCEDRIVDVQSWHGLLTQKQGRDQRAICPRQRIADCEFAAANVQINAIAQNYVSNPVYYPDELVNSERFQKHLARNVPIRRVAREEEQAELTLFLSSGNSDFIVGQIIPFAGGWVTT